MVGQQDELNIKQVRLQCKWESKQAKLAIFRALVFYKSSRLAELSGCILPPNL